MNPTEKFIQIDEEGYPLFGELRIQDEEVGAEILTTLGFNETGTLTAETGGEKVYVEAFDEPLVAQQVGQEGGQWYIQAPYYVKIPFSLESLSLDEWDRFHGYTENGIPFVLSRKAQAYFFNHLEDYTDDSITSGGKTYEIPMLLRPKREISEHKFWTDIYHEEGNPGWNLGDAANALKTMLPKLKLPKSRVLVLGCGEGHDAAFFAKDGHVVTGVDFSPEAIERAKKNYGAFSNLTFVEQDIFKLDRSFHQSFDIVFEHTCFCAIDPSRRSELVKVWNQCLAEKGHLLGVFFAMEKPMGPPYGATEWELRERLKRNYQFLFWGRWRQSLPNRQGKELFVYAQKRT